MTLLVRIAALALALVLAGCGSGAGNGGLTLPEPNALTVADIQRVIAQAVNEAKARQKPATIVVIDRVGNVLAAFQMNGAPKMFVFNGARGPILGGLEGVTLPIELASLSKALTAAYFSSNGNAFTTRTAGQVIQQNFNPSEKNTPAGPLFGVQFSQITCSDVSKTAADGTIGTKRSPIGFAADPGGLPLYKNGQVIGAIGVMSSSDSPRRQTSRPRNARLRERYSIGGQTSTLKSIPSSGWKQAVFGCGSPSISLGRARTTKSSSRSPGAATSPRFAASASAMERSIAVTRRIASTSKDDTSGTNEAPRVSRRPRTISGRRTRSMRDLPVP